MGFRVGIHIGGTFTDLFALEENTGRSIHTKCPSTPDHPEQAVFDTLTRSELDTEAIAFLVLDKR